nr:hypothetical protein [Amycolatopsis sp. CA-126428]
MRTPMSSLTNQSVMYSLSPKRSRRRAGSAGRGPEVRGRTGAEAAFLVQPGDFATIQHAAVIAEVGDKELADVDRIAIEGGGSEGHVSDGTEQTCERHR